MAGGTGAFQWGTGRRKLGEKATTHKFRSRDLSEILSSAWIKRLNPGYATCYKTHTHKHKGAKCEGEKALRGHTNRVTQGRRQQRSHGSLGIQGKGTVKGAKGNILREQPP